MKMKICILFFPILGNQLYSKKETDDDSALCSEGVACCHCGVASNPYFAVAIAFLAFMIDAALVAAVGKFMVVPTFMYALSHHQKP